MKVRMKFSGFGNYNKEEVVEYDGIMKQFAPYGTYDNRYWGAIMYDKDETGAADFVMLLSEHTKEAMPIDMNGNPLPVSNFETMFNIKPPQNDAVCECGAKFSSFSNHHMICCPKWSKE